jgi:hypothetical protein
VPHNALHQPSFLGVHVVALLQSGHLRLVGAVHHNGVLQRTLPTCKRPRLPLQGAGLRRRHAKASWTYLFRMIESLSSSSSPAGMHPTVSPGSSSADPTLHRREALLSKSSGASSTTTGSPAYILCFHICDSISRAIPRCVHFLSLLRRERYARPSAYSRHRIKGCKAWGQKAQAQTWTNSLAPRSCCRDKWQ